MANAFFNPARPGFPVNFSQIPDGVEGEWSGKSAITERFVHDKFTTKHNNKVVDKLRDVIGFAC